MQKFLTLVIVLVILYNIIKVKTLSLDDNLQTITQTVTDNSHQETSQAQKAGDDQVVLLNGNILEKTISKIIINTLKTDEGKAFFENILQPLNKPIDNKNYTIPVNKDLVESFFNIHTYGNGNIGPASCGHIVTIYYQIFDMSNNLLTQDTKTFSLGSRVIMPGIDNVVVGMMVGQTREAIIPAKYAYYRQEYRDKNVLPDSPYKVKIILKSLMPQNFINMSDTKIFDDEIAYKLPLLCGEKVSFDAKITCLSNGKILYDSKLSNMQISMKIGDIMYPLIFSYALYGKVPVGTRTVIAKDKAFKALGGDLNKIIPHDLLFTEGYLMLELSNLKAN